MDSPASHEQHRASAADAVLRCAVITVSDTRTPDTDSSGRYLREQLAAAGHLVVDYRIVPDEPAAIEPLLAAWVAAPDRDVILLNGGTGISRRDRTYDVVVRRLDQTLPGFGELFRMLSWDQVGAAAMLSRAVAGVAGDKLVVSVPGSTKAVSLAWEQLLAPELAHLVWEIRR